MLKLLILEFLAFLICLTFFFNYFRRKQNHMIHTDIANTLIHILEENEITPIQPILQFIIHFTNTANTKWLSTQLIRIWYWYLNQWYTWIKIKANTSCNKIKYCFLYLSKYYEIKLARKIWMSPVRLCKDCSSSQHAITASIAWTRTCCCSCSLKEQSSRT